jgi:hypothetical protein
MPLSGGCPLPSADPAVEGTRGRRPGRGGGRPSSGGRSSAAAVMPNAGVAAVVGVGLRAADVGPRLDPHGCVPQPRMMKSRQIGRGRRPTGLNNSAVERTLGPLRGFWFINDVCSWS